jgi:hypothetical protein
MLTRLVGAKVEVVARPELSWENNSRGDPKIGCEGTDWTEIFQHAENGLKTQATKIFSRNAI